ncbi:sigma-70 family RNA polymerase sigma factor [Actinoplanes sp. NPDC051411]|uniref:RNA polymerase sigma factor n=1 Tax=Actinoplanes sp. NPDC051411 TaxID=3155522 RepID=UPI003415778F
MTEPTRPAFDPETRQWLAGLRAEGRERESTNARLYADLLRVARIEARGRGAARGICGPELDDLAHHAAADAMMTIMRKLDEFRGESQFTTWAHRFVALDVIHKVGRHFWRRATVQLDTDEPTALSPPADDPERTAEWRALADAVRRSLDEDLTAHQRSAFVALVLHGGTAESVAEQLGANRNAVYKVVFDARRKIRTRLAADGLLG